MDFYFLFLLSVHLTVSSVLFIKKWYFYKDVSQQEHLYGGVWDHYGPPVLNWIYYKNKPCCEIFAFSKAIGK